MPRGGQVTRLYTLVMDLARTRRGLPVEVLARRRGWRVRTVYRDLHALAAAGFPIVRADGARWKLGDGWQARIPFPLPAAELLALHVARDLMKPLRGTPVARAFESLFERLVGPAHLGAPGQGELFLRVQRILATRSQLAFDYTVHAAVLETLCTAVEQRRTVSAVYYAETRRERAQREIDPYCLYYDPHLEALYVFGWCHLRRAIRTFAVHRFCQASLTARRFAVPLDFSPESYLRGALRIWHRDNAVRVRLRLAPEVAGWVTERRWHASQKVRHLDGGAAEIEFAVGESQELRRFILQLGASVEVLEPDWLRLDIAREHAAAARRNGARRKESLTFSDTHRLKAPSGSQKST